MEHGAAMRGLRVDKRDDNAMLALTFSGTAALLAMVAAFPFLLESRLVHEHQAMALSVDAAVGIAAALLTYFPARWLLDRVRVRWWQVAGVGAVMVWLVSAAPSAASYVFPDPMDRFHRELGGPGRCLNSSPYASDDAFPRAAQVTFPKPGRMLVTPLDHNVPPLLLAHAAPGGLDHLTAAEPASAAILRTYGC